MFIDSINIDLSKDKTVDEINAQNFILPTKDVQMAFNKNFRREIKFVTLVKKIDFTI